MLLKIENKLRLKRSESSKMTPKQAAFAMVVRFASAIQKQLEVEVCLDDFIRHVGVRSAILVRALSGDCRHIRIAAAGALTDAGEQTSKVNDVIEDPSLVAGTSIVLGPQLVCIVLRAEAGSVDLLQLKFEADAEREQLLDLEAMAPAMGIAWADRPPGSISRLIAAHHSARRAKVVELGSVAILDADNAFGLSRSEFRVCQLLGDGLRPIEIARALDLSIATVRTHLRGIYAKTELNGQVQVIHHLKTLPAA